MWEHTTARYTLSVSRSNIEMLNNRVTDETVPRRRFCAARTVPSVTLLFAGARQKVRKLSIVLALMQVAIPAWTADWLTDGGNAQRTAWQKDEKILTTANVKDMKLLWKLKLDNQPRVMHLHALNLVRQHKLFPPVKNGREVGENGGNALDRAEPSVRFIKREAQTPAG